jgi:UDP-N-acetylglucosamine diphosphorylase/glucosamine-1-phosphate N-acetyltransferase
LPNQELHKYVLGLKEGEGLFADKTWLAIRTKSMANSRFEDLNLDVVRKKYYCLEYDIIRRPCDLFTHSKEQIITDFKLITQGRSSLPLSTTVVVVGADKNKELHKQIFLEEGARVEHCYLNPDEGPIYIGKNAVVMEGSMLRGPIAVGEHSQINMGAKIYGGTTIGPWCKVGGEVSNSVITGYSNKVHDGYLGDSVIGEWCNLGAATNTSNLKNDFAQVKLWDYPSERFLKTNLQFCGLIMGDFSRCAINTQFNSGTVVGVGANIFGSGFPRNFVPSFVTGGAQGYRINPLKRLIETAQKAMARRNVQLSEDDEKVLQGIFEETRCFRKALK